MRIIKYLMFIFSIGLIVILIINLYVVASTKEQIMTSSTIKANKDIDCILILGAGVWEGSPSPMLKDRLNVGIELYKSDISNKLIMSGDHGREEYDEVNVMKEFAINNEINSEDIFMDHAGFSTYESIYRTKEIFQAKKIIIVTQKYHLYRALYIANKLGLEAVGISADSQKYSGQMYRELREILARNKDFALGILKPKPTYLGEIIPVNGNGDITNDKEKI